MTAPDPMKIAEYQPVQIAADLVQVRREYAESRDRLAALYTAQAIQAARALSPDVAAVTMSYPEYNDPYISVRQLLDSEDHVLYGPGADYSRELDVDVFPLGALLAHAGSYGATHERLSDDTQKLTVR